MSKKTQIYSFVAAIVKDIPGEHRPLIIAVYSSVEKAEEEFLNQYNGLQGYRVTQFIVR